MKHKELLFLSIGLFFVLPLYAQTEKKIPDDPSDMNLEFFSTGGPVEIDFMEAYRLESIWLKREQELGYYRLKR
jgi:hypothetical protein